MKPSSLQKHPEGGRFQEVFRSSTVVQLPSGATRSALTHIYFSLKPGEVSRFHRVASDEVWNLYRGAGLYIYTWDESPNPAQRIRLAAGSGHFCHVVAAGLWQAAEPIADETLVGCSVGPGFEFEDFELIDPGGEVAERLAAIDPEMKRFISL